MRRRVTSSDGGWQYGDEGKAERWYNVEGGSWQTQDPTWRGMAPHEETHVGAKGGTGGGREMESSREPLMAPSGQGPGENIGARRVTGGNGILGILLL